MTRITVATLEEHEDRAVYPLLREAVPTLTLSAWLRFARRLRSTRPLGHGGVVGARYAGRPFPSGLFCYRVSHDLEVGRVLSADHFVALDPLDSGHILQALLRELDSIAARLDCAAIHGLVRAREPGVVGGMFAAGLKPEAALFTRGRGRDGP